MAKFNHYKHLFTPIQVGRHTLKNRVEFAPLVCDMVAANGEVTQGYVDFVEKQAESGVALMHLGATPVNWENAADGWHELDVTDELKIGGLALLAEAAHRHGAEISVELVHAGRAAHPFLMQAEYAIAPTKMIIPDRAQKLREMNREDMLHVIDCYCDCASRLQRAGFDGVLIHGAHGNLIGQFLSPRTNHRTDEYGGTMENRFRFPLELLQAVRKTVGPDFLVEMRISGDEIIPEGMRVDEVIEFLKKAQEYIDMVTVSAGLIVEEAARFYCMPPYYHPRGFNVQFSRKIKACPDIHIPVSVVGGIDSADMADQILDEGGSDMVAIARALLTDGNLLNKAYRGEDSYVPRPCIRCWDCCGAGYQHIHCAVNPQLCRDARYSSVKKAETKKKVVVIGGGIAGTQAARTLTERGHEVVLFEKRNALGGMLPFIDKLPFKGDLKKYEDWLVGETLRCGAEIRLGTEATPELVMAENPDAIVVAVGGQLVTPPIPGIDRANVVSVLDADSGKVQLQGKIVICGGGLSGCESALALAMAGCTVTVVDLLPTEKFASGCSDITRSMLMFLLKQQGVTLLGGQTVREIGDAGVTVTDAAGKQTVLPADFVVSAFGLKPDKAAAEPFFELIPDVYFVGDCERTRNIMFANRTAYDRCCNI